MLSKITSRTLFVLLSASLLTLSACDSDSGGNVPVNEVFTGTLAFGAQNDHFFSLTEQTTIRYQIVSVVRDPVNEITSNSVSVALGSPTADGCAQGFSFGGTDGEFELIATPPGDHCVTVFEPGVLGDDQTITYTIQLTNL